MNEFTDKSPRWIYQQAENAKQDRRYNTAISIFRAFIKLHFEHKDIEQARLGLIDCYTACGQFEDALSEIDTFLRLYPDSIHYIELQEKKEALTRKKKMDWLYHLAWSQDVKNQHRTSYATLVRAVDILSE
jgi:outer membrane protein assembly factor BamD (BamD/ComL family)